MSLQQYQEAFAHLIRVPRQNRQQTVPELLSSFELSAEEQMALLQLARHRELNKYGREQAEQRWEQIERHIGRIFMVLDRQDLKEIWFREFEPLNAYTEVDNEGSLQFSLSFLKFLAAKFSYRRRLAGKNIPSFINALIDFEIAEVELMAPHCVAKSLKHDSALIHSYWRVVDFAVDVADIAAKLEVNIQADRHSRISVTKRDNTLLFVRNGPRQNPRVYEIDATFKALLLGELDGAKRKPWTKVQIGNLEAVGLYSHAATSN